MADAASTETPTQRAARLRREKREKKLAEGGADRLARITQTSGRQEDLQPKPTPIPSSLDSSDPPEIDISRTPPPFTSAGAARNGTMPPQQAGQQQDPFLALMQQAQSQLGGGGGGAGGVGNANGGPDPNDPIMKIMQQMFQPPPGTSSPIPGAAGTPGGPPGGLPPGLAALLNGGGGGGDGAIMGPDGQPQPAKPPSTAGYLWRIVHAIFSLSLAAYVAFVLPFDGSRAERDSPLADPREFFWIFATVELGLQSARFMMEGAGGAPAGWLGTVVGLLPQPWGRYVLLAMRYAGIWTTLSEDACMVLFGLGVVAWWKGRVEA